MEAILYSVIGGAIPCVGMTLVYLMTTEKRLARIETHIIWLKHAIAKCPQHCIKDTE